MGIYSNYIILINVTTRIMDSIFYSISASIGNLLTDKQNSQSKLVFDRILFLCAGLHGFLAISLFCLLNPFIQNWLGSEYIISMPIVFIICVNFYLHGARRPINIYKESGGIFWQDRYRTLIEATTNLMVSVPLTMKLGLLGTLLGTTISMMTFSFWYEAYLVYKKIFDANFKEYVKQQVMYAVTTLVIGSICFSVCFFIPCNNCFMLLFKVSACFLVNLFLHIIFYIHNKNIFFYLSIIKSKLMK